MPLYGVLEPNGSIQISFTFYGHCDIVAQAKALCEVEGGPTYEIILRGQASLISYSFDTQDINYGLQVLPTIHQEKMFCSCLNISLRPCASSSSEAPSSQSHHHPILDPSSASLTLVICPLPSACQTFSLAFLTVSEIQRVRHQNLHLPFQSRSPFETVHFFQ